MLDYKPSLMTPWYGNAPAFLEECTCRRWMHLANCQYCESVVLCFLLTGIIVWTNLRVPGDLRHPYARCFKALKTCCALLRQPGYLTKTTNFPEDRNQLHSQWCSIVIAIVSILLQSFVEKMKIISPSVPSKLNYYWTSIHSRNE